MFGDVQLYMRSCVLAVGATGMQTIGSSITRNAKDTHSRNQRQKTGVGFWRRFFTPVAKFLAPDTNMDERKVIKLSISLSVQLMLNRLNKLNKLNNFNYVK